MVQSLKVASSFLHLHYEFVVQVYASLIFLAKLFVGWKTEEEGEEEDVEEKGGDGRIA